VGALVRQAEEQGIELHDLPLERSAPRTRSSATTCSTRCPRRAPWRSREAVGGTGPNAVRAQLEAARAALTPPVRETPPHGNELIANVV
jgi:argininosuccinate lyase